MILTNMNSYCGLTRSQEQYVLVVYNVYFHISTIGRVEEGVEGRVEEGVETRRKGRRRCRRRMEGSLLWKRVTAQTGTS